MSEKAPEASQAAAGGSKMMSRIKIGLIVAAIVGAQCALAYMYLPSGAEAAASEHEKPVHDPLEDLHKPQREVNLGKFSLSALNPTTNTTLLIDFHLYGTTVEKESHADEAAAGDHGGHGAAEGSVDNSKFAQLYKKNEHRFRDQVIVIIRNAELADLTDPGLGLIKRQILAKTNALFGEPLLKEVIFSDFAVVEQ